MDPGAFARNWKTAGTICPALIDRCKYAFWLYNKWPGLVGNRSMHIRFAVAPPVNSVSLNVRCNHGSDAFIFSEIFLHRYYDFSLPEEPRTILDLGANIGFSTLFFARKYPSAALACVEPMPENVSLLNTNLRINSVTARVFPKAISVNDLPVTMQRAEKDYGHKVQNIYYGKQLNGDTLQVPSISMPNVLRELGWNRIALLKMDIEGYEGVLLRQNNEWLQTVDALCIECHEGFGEEDLRAIANTRGWRVQALAGTWLLTRN